MSQLAPKIFETKSGRSLEIRSLNVGDEENLQKFQRMLAEETTHTLKCKEKEISVEKLKVAIERTHSSPSELFLGVFDGHSIIGTLGFKVQMHEHPWVKHIGEFGMGILQDYWNQGIGKELLHSMERFAVGIGVSRIEAKVRCQNERGIALYKRSGFKIEGVRERGALINGKFENEYFIAKFMNAEKSDKKPLAIKEITYKDESFEIVLRPISEDQAEAINGALSRSLSILHPFMEWSHLEMTVEGQVKRIRKSREDALEGICHDFSVFSLETGEFLMSASLQPSRVPNKKCFGIGYWVTADHCNQGLATLVTRILIVLAFEHFGCDRVEISANKANKPSLRVIEKCGFRYEGEVKNFFSAPTPQMLENGYYPERTGLQFGLTKEDVPTLEWFKQISKKLVVGP